MSFIYNFKTIPVATCSEKRKILIPKQALIDLIKLEVMNGGISRSFTDDSDILEYLKSCIDAGTITPYIVKYPIIKEGINSVIKCEKDDFELYEYSKCIIPVDKAISLNMDRSMKGEVVDIVAIGLEIKPKYKNSTRSSDFFKNVLSAIDSTIADIDNDMEECSKLPPIPNQDSIEKNTHIVKRRRVLRATTNSEGKVKLQEIDEDYHEPQ